MDCTPDHDQHMLEGTLAENAALKVRETVLKEVVLKMASEVDAAQAELAEGVALLRLAIELCDLDTFPLHRFKEIHAFLSLHPAPSAEGGGHDS